MRDFYRDMQQAVLALLAGPVAIAVLLFVAVAGLSYCAGQRTIRDNRMVAALADTVRLTDSVIVVRAETVTVTRKIRVAAQAVSDSTSRVVTLRDDSTVVIRDTVREAPPELIADNRALRATNAALLAENLALYAKDTTQEWRIATRDKLIRELGKQAHPRCGKRCGFALGVAASVLVYKAVK